MLSDSDTIINIPLEDVLARHIATGADITAVCTAAGGDGQDTYFRLDGGGRITDTAYSLHTPSGYRCLNIFVLRTELLVQLVDGVHQPQRIQPAAGTYCRTMGNRLKLYGYVYDGYAAHISTLQNYYDRSMELLDTGVRGRLFCPERPVYGQGERLTLQLHRPGGRLREFAGGRRLRHPGQREKLRAVPRRAH